MPRPRDTVSCAVHVMKIATGESRRTCRRTGRARSTAGRYGKQNDTRGKVWIGTKGGSG